MIEAESLSGCARRVTQQRCRDNQRKGEPEQVPKFQKWALQMVPSLLTMLTPSAGSKPDHTALY